MAGRRSRDGGPPGPPDEGLRERVRARLLAPVKPYVSIAELATLTPWTEQAIRTMMSRGVLREGEHFFHVGRRPVIKWAAIVDFVQRRGDYVEGPPDDPVPHYRDGGGWADPEKPGGKPVRSK